MVRYLGDKLINNVAVIGGTHGNERIGVALAKWWIDHPQELERPSFRTRAVLANTAAAAKNLRYVDTDLNRLFTAGEPRNSQLAEVQRAEELERELGGAKTTAKSEGACDFIIDLHSTTSNMGLSLVMCAENDLFSHRVALAMDRASGGSLKVRITPCPCAHIFRLNYLKPDQSYCFPSLFQPPSPLPPPSMRLISCADDRRTRQEGPVLEH